MKKSALSRRQMLKLAGAAGVAGVLGAPRIALASDDGNKRRLYIGFSLHPTGPTTNVGTFDMSGRFEDSGSSIANAHTAASDEPDHSRLYGDQQFAGQKGTIVTTFNGIAFPNNNPHAVGEGRFKIVSGTGAYTGIRGQGTFLVVVDFTSGQLIGTEVGNVESSGED